MDALSSSGRDRTGREAAFRVGRAEIDPVSRDVTYDRGSERIQDKPLRVLMLLHRRSGRVVTREDIVDECWEGRIIGDDVINRAVSILRKLARRAGGFRIETIPRVGYRLLESKSIEARPGKPGRILAMAIASALIIALAVGLFVRSPPGPAGSPTISLLPIVLAKGNADTARLGAKVERSLANALHDSGLALSSRSDGDLRISGEITATAARTRIDFVARWGSEAVPVMSRSFERPTADADALPLEVAADLAESIAVIARFLTLDGGLAEPALALRLFAMAEAGRQGDILRWHQIALRTAREHPDSAAADLMQAMSYGATLQAFTVPERKAHVQIARQILERRREFAPKFGEFGQAWCVLRPRAWIEACESQLRVSLKSGRPGDSAPQRLAELVADVGRTEEALWLARLSYAKDPYFSPNAGILLHLLEIDGRHREADALYARAIRKWPTSWTLRWNRIMGLAARGDFASLEKFAATIPQSEFQFDAEVIQSVVAAHRTGDQQQMIRACGDPNLRWSTKQVCVATLAAVGELDASFAIAFELYPKHAGRNPAEDEVLWLERPEYFTLSLLSAPAGAPLRRDPRFLALAAQTGLLRYWRDAQLPDFCAPGAREPVCRELRTSE